jgi:LAO/AO transport system kinase
MNVFSLFFAGMMAIGVTVAVVLRLWPHFNAFDFMPYIAIFAAMGVLELGVLFSGKLAADAAQHALHRTRPRDHRPTCCRNLHASARRRCMSVPSLHELRSGGKVALARALAAIETHANYAGACRAARRSERQSKGTYPRTDRHAGRRQIDADQRTDRAGARCEQTIAVIAVDPSSKATGGALLGDRARMTTNPDDKGVFVRSMAARDRLGGISNETIAAAVLMRALYDRVIVETVGVGQSESDIAGIADTVLLCIQPGAGDSLQFMKAGLMELPDVIAVTKSDMGAAARRARADVKGALGLSARGEWSAPVVMISATSGDGLDELDQAIETHKSFLNQGNRHEKKLRRTGSGLGRRSHQGPFRLRRTGSLARRCKSDAAGPFSREAALAEALRMRLNPLTGK